jgi:hypothetical protein
VAVGRTGAPSRRPDHPTILGALVEAGQVELDIETTAGRQAAIYRVAE